MALTFCFLWSTICPRLLLAAKTAKLRLTKSQDSERRGRTRVEQIDLNGKSAQDIIKRLALLPHPEGGHYRQTWIGEEDERPSGTCIYFLLGAGERSHWHTVDATEIWHHYAGAPLILSLSETDTGPAKDHVLGPNLFQGQSPQIIVPPHNWQAARSTGDWTLMGCTVSPAFQFDGFTLAPPGFDIPRAG
ncbi:MAG: cupin domain-containing protein [Marivita sp.]|nr:cupin domain-containing protein [Marivita sp.]